MELNADDEFLVSDHAYNACRNALDYVSDRASAKVVVVPIPFPVTSDEEIITAVTDRVTDRTRMLLIDRFVLGWHKLGRRVPLVR